MSETKKDMSFEEALARLEVIVKGLDGGDVPLDKSLELFEEGVALVKLCNSKLEGVERKIKIVNGGEESDFADE
ncbi:MAG: exodeoxyribonuclease VII small subunit [Clostridia bacterium]|nr:exodeoxyribonuclease VII small subunit [Clostridia bacterium]